MDFAVVVDVVVVVVVAASYSPLDAESSLHPLHCPVQSQVRPPGRELKLEQDGDDFYGNFMIMHSSAPGKSPGIPHLNLCFTSQGDQ